MSVIGHRLENVKDDIMASMRGVVEMKEELVQVRRRANLKP